MNEQAAVDRNENERSEWHEHKHYTHRTYMHIHYTDGTHARANEKCIQVRKTIQLQWSCVCVCVLWHAAVRSHVLIDDDAW